MHFGLMKKIFQIYKVYKLIFYRICYYFLGFEYINCKLQYNDKRLIIPVLRAFGANIAENCEIESPLIINAKENYKNLIIRKNVYIGKNVTLDLKGCVEIKENATVSFGTTIISHIDVGKSIIKKKYKTNHKKTVIGSNCYTGANSTILKGVELGENCLVSAGSVVTKSFSANSLVGGIPARLIKKINIISKC